MLDIPSCEGLAALTEAAKAVAPRDDGRVSVLYSSPYGIGQYVVSTAALPKVLLPEAPDLRHTDVRSSTRTRSALSKCLSKGESNV